MVSVLHTCGIDWMSTTQFPMFRMQGDTSPSTAAMLAPICPVLCCQALQRC